MVRITLVFNTFFPFLSVLLKEGYTCMYYVLYDTAVPDVDFDKVFKIYYIQIRRMFCIKFHVKILPSYITESRCLTRAKTN